LRSPERVKCDAVQIAGSPPAAVMLGTGPTIRSVAWKWYIGGGCGLSVVYFLLPTVQAKLIVWPAIGWSSVAAISLGVRLHRPDARSAWILLTTGVTVFIVGDNLYSFRSYVQHSAVPFPSYVDIIYLAMYPLLIAGLVLLVRKRTPGRDVASILDVCIIVFAVGLLSWVLLIVPYFRSADMSVLARLTSISYPLGDMALFAVAVRLVFGSGRRPAAFWLLVGSVVALFTADGLYGYMNLAGTWHEHNIVDIGWIIFYVGWGAAALHPSMHDLSVRASGSPRVGVRRLGIVASAALIPPMVLAVQQSKGGVVDGYAIAGIGGLLFVLVLVRTTGLAREVADTHSEARFRALFENASDAVVVLDASGRVRYSTPSTERVLGQDADRMFNQPIREFLSDDDGPELSVLLSTPGVTRTLEWRVRRADHSLRDVEVIAVDLRSDARINGLVLTMRDISERKTLDSELRRQALHDTLTGLPNKVLFDDRVAHALGRADRASGSVAVLFLDLDNFKLVNDSLGHTVGDELLVAVTARLVSVVKSGDTVARFGGDEFVVLLEDDDVDAAAHIVSERFHQALAEPFEVNGEAIPLHASIGIAIGQAGACSPNQLLRDADLAMYVAKRNGRGRSERFAPEMHRQAARRLEVASELPAAIRDDQLVLFYQPIVDISSERILAAEALVRWNHPRRGLIFPDEFIPVAESTGIVVALDRWVLDDACRQTSEWRRTGIVDDSFYISVNVSARHFKDHAVVDDIVHALNASHLPPSALLVEVTESALEDYFDPDGSFLRELKAIGVRLAIDDFGTGYSSLARLSDFPIDIVKIDKSFVDRLSGDADGETMVRAVVELSHSLGMQAVAEGVESREQAVALERLGCTLAQGYLFARPMPADAMTHALIARDVPSQ
jgi:diguanylate cyclase (GGDEF)-like protein/PAS domain S-box-containing protein